MVEVMVSPFRSIPRLCLDIEKVVQESVEGPLGRYGKCRMVVGIYSHQLANAGSKHGKRKNQVCGETTVAVGQPPRLCLGRQYRETDERECRGAAEEFVKGFSLHSSLA